MNRREILKLSAASAVSAITPAIAAAAPTPAASGGSVRKYDVFEIILKGPTEGNPFLDTQLRATFSLDNRSLEVEGFYDGDGSYKVRFMPDTEGTWRYSTTSNAATLTGKTGTFACTAAAPKSHGPVVVRGGIHFSYADGAPYFPFGTTCYAWAHQGDQMEEETLTHARVRSFQ